MSNKTNSTRPPSYRLHKASGQAVVTISGKDHYLGVHGTPESRLRYERLITAWMQGESVPANDPDSSNDIAVAEVCAQYLRWAEGYYVKDGETTTELVNVKRAIKALAETYPSLPAKDFGPVRLKAVRDRFIADGLSRVNCNRYTRIIGRIFKFAAENEWVPGDLPAGLACVKPLAKGRGCAAHETEPVLPVDEETIDATLPALNEKYRAMVKVQLLLACRPGELVTMRTGEIDRSGPVWVYRPRSHKTEHHGKDRIIPIGPKAQLLLAPFLQADPDRFIFRSQRGGHIMVDSYNAAIHRACDEAGIEHWSANQLRHAGATRIRQQDSLDAAQVILGHSSRTTTEQYAEKNIDAALRIAALVG